MQRTHLRSILVTLGLASGAALGGGFQDPADENPVLDNRAPLTAFTDAESARIEEEIQGAWILTGFATREGIADPEDYRGFAMFDDGFMSMSFQGQSLDPGIFTGPIAYSTQAGLHRFRISAQLTLQTAAVMGYISSDSNRSITFERSGQAREYNVRLIDGELVLSNVTGTRFTYRRVQSGAFPVNSARELERSRGRAIEEDY